MAGMFFSMPKSAAQELISMHLKRGDNIYFITARKKTKTETLTTTLKKYFMIPDAKMNPVIFTGAKKDAKVPYIKQYDITVYYGDADSDIVSARKANALPIRVMRSPSSTNRPMPKNGSLGEQVLINSQY